jgi:hypothetical protein
VKEGLEMNWKGGKDSGNDDDDEEEIAGGKVERRRNGNLKKEEGDDDQAWKMLPEAVVSSTSGEILGTSGEDHSQSAMLPPPVPALYQDAPEAQPQTLLDHVPLPVPSTVSFEDSGNFLLPSNGNTYSSAHVALPQTQDSQAFSENYQPYYFQ